MDELDSQRVKYNKGGGLGLFSKERVKKERWADRPS